MIFNTVSYFLAFLVPASWAFRWSPIAWRPWVLSASGAVFFVYYSVTAVGGWAGAACLGILLLESLTSRLYRTASRWCFLGVALALLALGAFKYWNFLVSALPGNLSQGLHWSGAFLPLGLSFFTFEFIHYAVDRRRGTAEEARFSEYLAFILFFPTMVAGPIKRIQDFLPVLRSPLTGVRQDWEIGWTRILVGLAKKCVLADTLTALTVHLNRTDLMSAQRWVLPVWLLAFGFQIYFDFSAYSDIAIGSARLFGIPVKENFNWPYLSTNIAEFWRRWHISLSRWLTDYVFIPLGGSRVAPPRVYANLLVTLMVSGLWHGAGTNFLAWGAWHGVGLAAQKGWSGLPLGSLRAHPAYRLGSGLLTFLFVQLGWAFFVMDLPTAVLFLKRCLGILP